MTYHDDLHPSRRESQRPWLIALPLAIVVALGVAWSFMWYYAAGAAETAIAEWRAQQAKDGRAFSCAKQETGGFPFRIEVRCLDAAAELKDAQPPLTIRVKQVLAVAQVWDPKLIIAEFTAPLTATQAGAPYATATWTLAQASVRGMPAVLERASIVVDGLRLNSVAQGNPVLFDSKHAEFHARMQFGSWPSNPALDLALKLEAATAPTVHAYMAQPFDADVLAVLHGLKDFSPKPLNVRLREWQANGGKLEIQSARLAQGEARATSTGLLGLTQQGRLDGTLKLAAAGLERYLPTMGEGRGGAMSLDRAAPALNAIERAVPNLAGRIAPQQPNLQAGLLALLGQPVDIEGKRGVSVPVKFTDGQASFGPIPLGQVPALF
ncbi:MAG: DUF2125 domain-containing protein [Alphaproteobacteria bacterium]|nr:DUF2125 domain-containing protein [Alphaproteobacteria bacterium]